MDKFLQAISTQGRLVPIRWWMAELERKQALGPALEGMGQVFDRALRGVDDKLIDNLLVKVSEGRIMALNGWRMKPLPFSCCAYLADCNTAEEAVSTLAKVVGNMGKLMERQCRGIDFC